MSRLPRIHRTTPLFLGGTSLHRGVALWLLVLAASPFTAPFATYDVGQSGNSTPLGDASAKVKSWLGEVAIVSPTYRLDVIHWEPVAAQLTDAIDQIGGHRVQYAVLRI